MKNIMSIQPQDEKIIKRHDTGVLLHLYYPEMWNEILSYLSNLGEHFDLFVTIPHEVSFSVNLITARYPYAYIYSCENRGRDVAPFLKIFFSISNLGYKYLCKIHTKRNTQVTTLITWRRDMLQKLLGSPEIVSRIKTAFDNHPTWGMIAPQGHIVPSSYYWRQNSELVTKLAHSIGIPTDSLEFSYVAGTMFWFRPQALELLQKANINFQDFVPEPSQPDGTLAHALERFFGLATTFSGHQIAENDSYGVRPAKVSYHLQVLSHLFNDQLQTVLSLEQENRSLREHILNLEKHISSVDNENQTRGQQILALESHLRTIEEEYQSRGQQILALENHGHTIEEENQKLKSLISSIYHSSSWRITQPIRNVKTFMQKTLLAFQLQLKKTKAFDYRALFVTQGKKKRFAESVSHKFEQDENYSSNQSNVHGIPVSDQTKRSVPNKPNQNMFFNRSFTKLPYLKKAGDQYKISVVVTSYNHEKYIRQCLDSILMQKGFFDIEIILGDDCSSDNTYEIIQEYKEKYHHIIRILPNEVNLGVTQNLKRCLDACTGEFIAICEGDDYWISEDKLQKQMSFLEEHEDFSMCFSSILLLIETEKRLIPHHDQYMLDKGSISAEDLIKTNYIGNFSCCMYRADAIREIPPSLFEIYVVDWMFNIVCSEWGKIGFIKDWMSVYRLHSTGGWTGKSDREKYEILISHIDTYNQFLGYKYDSEFQKLKSKISHLLFQAQTRL